MARQPLEVIVRDGRLEPLGGTIPWPEGVTALAVPTESDVVKTYSTAPVPRPSMVPVSQLDAKQLQEARDYWKGRIQPMPPRSPEWLALSEEERLARLRSVRGSMKGMLSTVDEFIESRREDLRLEEEKWLRRTTS